MFLPIYAYPGFTTSFNSKRLAIDAQCLSLHKSSMLRSMLHAIYELRSLRKFSGQKASRAFNGLNRLRHYALLACSSLPCFHSTLGSFCYIRRSSNMSASDGKTKRPEVVWLAWYGSLSLRLCQCAQVVQKCRNDCLSGSIQSRSSVLRSKSARWPPLPVRQRHLRLRSG